MHTVLIVVHLMIVLALVVTVLLQRSEGGALGIGGGGGGFMSGRGKANALTMTTAWLAAGFFATSIALAIMAGTNRVAPSLIQRAAPPGQTSPAVPTSGGILDTLKQPPAGAPAPAAPAAPSAPISGQ
ncbi:preprotein translocase subunit SecG [Terrihabitans soli]|uniref:Protein-export membrane protein SecG n=1 Tax=Terrihabitans soli TaxID=708113 RepID=A0A6S6QSW2_9HYPH|nr:preprotein translocase subunit SecG [Terrihabitans soli]BCJ91047.1 preprotein translocase subunit SecG [Terrihabitans soli]